ncbi:MAG: site-specific integrase [Pseudomonadota bacterium]
MTKPNNLSPKTSPKPMERKRYKRTGMRLYDSQSRRLYINFHERVEFAGAARSETPEIRCFCAVLLHTGCRLSEARRLRADNIQVEQRVICFKTLKQREEDKIREVPIPDLLANDMRQTFGLDDPTLPKDRYLWSYRGKPVNRSTAYRWIKRVMAKAKIEGQMAFPKGLRHGFGVHAVRVGVPLNLIQKWLGHSEIDVTAFYANAIGKEEREIAARMWAEENPPLIGADED